MTSQASTQHQVVNLNAVIRHVEASLARVVAPTVKVERRLYDQLDPIAADPAAIERLLLALGRGAREALPNGGTLTIETDTVFLDSELVARWPGMSAGAYSMLMVRDSRQVRRDSVGSIGLVSADLAEAKTIAEQAGGHVEIQMIPGTGRVCKTFFPALDPETVSARVAPVETIMVVDDTEGLREMMQRILSTFGYSVLLAKDGAEALKVSESYHGQIDLLISDVVMPGIGGPELAVRLRMRRPTLRVLLMSGYDEHVLSAGGGSYASFIAKPFRPESLAKRIREVLDAPEGVRPA